MKEGIDYPMGTTKFEYELVCTLIKSVNPKTYLEIGSRLGGSLKMFANLASDRVIAVDSPRGDKPGEQIKTAKTLQASIDYLGLSIQVVALLKADSKLLGTVAQVKEWLAGDLVDVLFIDGGHDFYTVASDVHNYTPLVRDDGLVIFHDVGFVKARTWVKKPEKVDGLIFHINSVHGVFRAFATGRRFVMVQEQWGLAVVWK